MSLVTIAHYCPFTPGCRSVVLSFAKQGDVSGVKPVIAGSLAVRDNEISKETDIRHVGAVCLSCGNRQSKATEPDIARHFPPIQWDSYLIDARRLTTAFVEGSIVQNYIEQRAVDLQAAVVVNETQFPKPVHEKADSRTSGPNHLG